MKIGCVILNYNDYLTTLNLINTIKNYNKISNIIVVDNKSSDNSIKHLKKQESNKVKVIETNHNGGYSYGNNYGLKYLEKENLDYVIVANPDVCFEENIIDFLVDVFQNDSMVAQVAPFVLDAEGNKTLEPAWKLNSGFFDLLLTSRIFNLFFKKKNKYSLNNFTKKELLPVDILPGSFLFLDYKKFKTINFFDDRVFLYCEERILSERLKQKNYKSILIINKHYIHAHSTSINKSISSEYKRKSIWLKSRKFFFLEYKFKGVLGKTFVKLFFVYLRLESFLFVFLKTLKRKKWTLF